MSPERLILFSEPLPTVMDSVKQKIFASKPKIFAYMPSDGSDEAANVKYTPFWQDLAESNNTKFLYLNNSLRGPVAVTETKRLFTADVLVITGGNTFKLLKHLRESGFAEAIRQFFIKGGMIVGFSAGALVLTPSIQLATATDNNEVQLDDLTGLGLVDFEVWPHFNPEKDQDLLDELQQQGRKIKPITNQDFLVI